MQGKNASNQNVVSLFAKKEERDQALSKATGERAEQAAEAEALNDIMSKNAKNAERVAKERADANKSVLRSYRIKH